jgi:phage replication O-like protein O
MDESTTIASPQAEDGHIEIANELAEAFYNLQLSGHQWRLLWVIIRQTYGWKKKQDQISFTFFEQRTRIDRRNIAHALSDLAERNIIVKNNNGFITSYGIQKDYVKWIRSPLLKSTTRTNKTPLCKDDRSKPLLKTPVVKSTTKPLSKSTPTKETKETIVEGIFSQISVLVERYPNQETINQGFTAISSTRKSNRIADSVKLSILKSWERYPVESVMAGIKTYLEKGYAAEGKREAYLLGIIRNNGNGQHRDSEISDGQVMKSTGSKALDDHYRSQGVRIA